MVMFIYFIFPRACASIVVIPHVHRSTKMRPVECRAPLLLDAAGRITRSARAGYVFVYVCHVIIYAVTHPTFIVSPWSTNYSNLCSPSKS